MDLSVEEILRRLLMLGLPLVPLSCSSTPLRDNPDAMVISGEAGAGGASGAGQGGGGAGSAAGGASGAGQGGGGTGSAAGGASGTGQGGGGAGSTAGAGSSVECGGTPSSPFDLIVMAERSYDPLGWDTCAGPMGDCSHVCHSGWYRGLNTIVQITTCERVAPALTGDGGVEAGADASDVADGATATLPTEVTIHVAGTWCVAGRRPAGLGRLPVPARGSSAGRWLARAAALEAASVPAFQRLAEELRGARSAGPPGRSGPKRRRGGGPPLCDRWRGPRARAVSSLAGPGSRG